MILSKHKALIVRKFRICAIFVNIGAYFLLVTFMGIVRKIF